MKNTSIFCLTLNPEHEKPINKLGLIPVGLGNKSFSKNFLTDKNGISISEKNPFYGEYTFHYWLWKNYLNKITSEWVGFCQYRKFFVKKKILTENLKLSELKDNLFINPNEENNKYDCFLGESFSVQNIKISKIAKHHLGYFFLNPQYLFWKKKRNLKFQFELFHGKQNLETAMQLLEKKHQNMFKEFMNTKTSFNPHNMFFCKKEILARYYEIIFPWLSKCEEIFSKKKLEGYGLKRIYGFLAERFLSFWFTKNYKYKELPIIIKDISNYKNL